jgi:hypothetical protein
LRGTGDGGAVDDRGVLGGDGFLEVKERRLSVDFEARACGGKSAYNPAAVVGLGRDGTGGAGDSATRWLRSVVLLLLECFNFLKSAILGVISVVEYEGGRGGR